MSTTGSVAARRPPFGSGRAGPAAARGFHLVLSLLLAAMVLAGFWPYYKGLVSGTLEVHWLLHAHAAVFSGWLVLFFIQALLVYSRRVDLHRRLGPIGIAYGIFLVLVGLVTTVAVPVLHVSEGRWTVDEAASFLMLPLGDMLLFVGFFAAAIAWRRRRELHRPLMVTAAIVLVFPAVARFAHDYGMFAVLLGWLMPLALAMGHDLATRGRVAPAYLAGLVLLVLAFMRIWLMETEAWLKVGRPLVLWMLPQG